MIILLQVGLSQFFYCDHILMKKKQVDVDVFCYILVKKNAMDGVGYSSDVGPRLQLGWLNLGLIVEAEL